jgi:hypothetical protein
MMYSKKLPGRWPARIISGASLFLCLIAPVAVRANPVPDRLSDPALVKAFYAVTARLNCQCSCHGLLGDCPHIDEDCFGVQTRRFVETRILEGMDEDAIVDGLVSGFGERVREDRQLRFLAARGRGDLVEGYIRGFGSSILHVTPSPVVPLLGVAALVLLFGFLVAYKLFRTRRSASGKSVAGDVSALETRIRRSIDSLDR